jgi:hypothetical protein
MKKLCITCMALFIFISSFAQANDDTLITKTINQFFIGMESSDTALISSTITADCYLKSISVNKEGKTIISNDGMGEFYRQVIELKGVPLDEKLLSIKIQIDGAMAFAWTPYKFYFKGQFSHCGVNVFSLVKINNAWKIMGITDTRRRLGCE